MGGLQSDVFTSQKEAAAAYNAPESTLRGRLKGQQPHAVVYPNQHRLTPYQEVFMVDWVLYEDRRTQPPPHQHVREMDETSVVHVMWYVSTPKCLPAP